MGVGQVVQRRLSCSRLTLGSQRTQQALHRALPSTSLPATDLPSPPRTARPILYQPTRRMAKSSRAPRSSPILYLTSLSASWDRSG